MWHLKSIHATNLCSFLDLSYAPKQGAATLIFGYNQDSDSQNSNGSGKSALIEAIAVGLTGEPLRKVNIDEIINDTQNAATVQIVLYNTALTEEMAVTRCLSRKQPQHIQIIKRYGPDESESEEVVQATVADYNKYILDQLGLSKEDIFNNFILTARKYKSFLASSDKEKKELINRFSNGTLVDQSIEALQLDITPLAEELNEAERAVAMCTGRVEAIGTEIERAIEESVERQAATQSRIQHWEDMIVQKRQDIRSANQQIQTIDENLDCLDELEEDMQTLESSDQDVNVVLQIIATAFKKNELRLDTDYEQEIATLDQQLIEVTKAATEATAQSDKLQSALQQAELEYKQTCDQLDAQRLTNSRNRTECTAQLERLTKVVREIQNKADTLTHDEMTKKREEAGLRNQLAGVIQCPKCKYEFILHTQVNVEEIRANLKTIQDDLAQITQALVDNKQEYNNIVVEGQRQREIETSLDQEQRQIKSYYEAAERALNNAQQLAKQQEYAVIAINGRLTTIQTKLAQMRKRIFDEVFDILDSAFKKRESQIKILQEDIDTMNGSIESYEKAIKDAKQASEEDVIASLKKSQVEYQKALKTAIKHKDELTGKVSDLRVQEAHFVEFKTYLANTKINAIAQITNEFLETIGSDIRVALSGYTILKSGKVRDKISVSLLRDGVDCGSFEKFSAGERVRVELASILSMNKLINLNCNEGKGLDLLIADEVLDSADEQGLASVFKALNQTQITSLVVSHGLVTENYPNKITVTKCNGVSSIYENTNTQH